VAWGRLAVARAPGEAGEGDRARPPPTRATPLSLVRREDLPWLLDAFTPSAQEAGEEPQLGAHARRALALLEQRGALFFHELRAGAGLQKAELSEALWELVAAGLVACDGFGAVRQLAQPARRVPQLVAGGSPEGSQASGRWSLLRPFAPPDGEGFGERAPFTDAPECVVRLAHQDLRRYGIVFRDLLAREPRCPPFRELLRIYRRLEARGELRGGRFVNGFSGEQFALPDALDALRSVRRAPKTGEERVLLSAVDPLNLAGILTPGPRIPAQAGNRLLLVDGVPQPLTQSGAQTA
jgi:ATP-dependent Lhr-like helicase